MSAQPPPATEQHFRRLCDGRREHNLALLPLSSFFVLYVVCRCISPSQFDFPSVPALAQDLISICNFSFPLTFSYFALSHRHWPLYSGFSLPGRSFSCYSVVFFFLSFFYFFAVRLQTRYPISTKPEYFTMSYIQPLQDSTAAP